MAESLTGVKADANAYTRIKRAKRLNGDEDTLGSLSLESKNNTRVVNEKFGFYELDASVDDILFAENGFRVLHEDGLKGFNGYTADVAHRIGQVELSGISIACYENTKEDTLVVSIIIGWPSN